MIRVYRVFYFAVAVTIASATMAPGSVRAGPGDCTSFSAADIDSCFVEWAAATEFDVMVDAISCDDDPSGPDVSLLANIDGPGLFHVFVFPSPSNAARLISFTPVLCNTLTQSLGIPEAHICRAEILRSFTWRQLCAQQVNRSPQN